MDLRTRDRVWDYVLLAVLVNDRTVVSTDVADVSGVSTRTVQEVLGLMAEQGWLSMRVNGEGTREYSRGPRIETALSG